MAGKFFFKKMLPVVVGVNGVAVLVTPLSYSQTAGFLLRKSGCPFVQAKLMKFFFGVNERYLLVCSAECIARIARFVQFGLYVSGDIFSKM